MLKLIKLPDGSSISPELIKVVQPRKDKGVIILDAQLRIAGWIAVTDEEKRARVLHLLNGVVNYGHRAQQPDWSFLENEVKA